MAADVQQVVVEGDVQGQVAVGQYVVQIGAVHGGVVNLSQGAPPSPQARPRPVRLRPRRAVDLLDRRAALHVVDAAARSVDPVAFYARAGSGKTALLRYLTHYPPDIAAPEGIVYLSARHQTAADLLLALYDVFYERPSDVKPTETQIRHALQECRALIFIDDLELVREDVEMVLDSVPRAFFVLASEQRTLWGIGESRSLPGLPKDAGVMLVERALGRSLTDAERDHVGALCDALEGHPLSLLQLTAQVVDGTATFAALRGEIEAQTERQSEREPTHQSKPIAEASAVALNALSDEQKKMLALLALTDGAPLPEEHLTSLAGLDDVLPILEALKQRHLVQAHSPSYCLTGDLRAVLLERWNLDVWWAHLRDYALAWAQDRQGASEAAQDTALWLIGVVREGVCRRDWSGVLALARALDSTLALSGYWGRWQGVLEAALKAAQALGDQAAEAWAHHQLGSSWLCLEASTQARSALSKALRLRQMLGDQAGAAVTRHNLRLLLLPPGPPPTDRRSPLVGDGGGLAGLSTVLKGMLILVGLIALGGLFVGGRMLLSLQDTPTPIILPTETATPTPSPTEKPPSPTSTPTPTYTPTATATATATPTPTFTPTPSPADLLVTVFEPLGSLQVSWPEQDELRLPVSVQIFNRGGTEAPVFKISLLYNPIDSVESPLSVAFTPFKEENVYYPFTQAPLPPGEDVIIQGWARFPTYIRGTTVLLRAMADSCRGEELVPRGCRVQESDEENNLSMEIKVPILGIPRPLIPEDGTQRACGYDAMDLTWAAVPRAERYNVEVEFRTDSSYAWTTYRNVSLSSDATQTVEATLRADAQETYLPCGQYRWRVQGADPSGNEGPWSDWSEFFLYILG